MSSGKLDKSGAFQSVVVQSQQTQLTLSSGAVRMRKNGIEFKSAKPVSTWSEMTVDMQCPETGKRVNFTGVVVACEGNRHAGYLVSMVFTNMSRQSQERLQGLLWA